MTEMVWTGGDQKGLLDLEQNVIEFAKPQSQCCINSLLKWNKGKFLLLQN